MGLSLWLNLRFRVERVEILLLILYTLCVSTRAQDTQVHPAAGLGLAFREVTTVVLL